LRGATGEATILVLVGLGKPPILLPLRAAFRQSAHVLKQIPLLSLLLLKASTLLVPQAAIATASASSTVANSCRTSLLESITIATTHNIIISKIGASEHTSTHGSLPPCSSEISLVPEALATHVPIILHLLGTVATTTTTEIIHTAPGALRAATTEAGASRCATTCHCTGRTATIASHRRISGAKSTPRAERTRRTSSGIIIGTESTRAIAQATGGRARWSLLTTHLSTWTSSEAARPSSEAARPSSEAARPSSEAPRG